MPDTRVKVPAAYAVVLEHLRREILLGTYAPGEKLPPEREHAEQLGVSRVTLREAVRVLEGEGLVEVRRGSMGGTIIRASVTSSSQLRRRRDEVRATLDFRLAIEPLAAARAAEHRTAAAVKALERSIDELKAATTIGAFRRADSVFHMTLARNAACPPLVRAVEDARVAMFEPIDAIGFEIASATAIDAHTQILAAVRKRDADAARAAMEEHIRQTRREFEGLF